MGGYMQPSDTSFTTLASSPFSRLLLDGCLRLSCALTPLQGFELIHKCLIDVQCGEELYQVLVKRAFAEWGDEKV